MLFSDQTLILTLIAWRSHCCRWYCRFRLLRGWSDGVISFPGRGSVTCDPYPRHYSFSSQTSLQHPCLCCNKKLCSLGIFQLKFSG